MPPFLNSQSHPSLAVIGVLLFQHRVHGWPLRNFSALWIEVDAVRQFCQRGCGQYGRTHVKFISVPHKACDAITTTDPVAQVRDCIIVDGAKGVLKAALSTVQL